MEDKTILLSLSLSEKVRKTRVIWIEEAPLPSFFFIIIIDQKGGRRVKNSRVSLVVSPSFNPWFALSLAHLP